jgi:type II secretory pathway pseudopilin PulG
MKKSFTMLELIMVIVIIGIIAAVIIPRTGSNKLAQAALQVVTHIRYTQHLAMVDDKYDPNSPYWYRQRWQIAFSTAASTRSYTVFSDSPSVTTGAYDGNPSANIDYTKVEVAVNPADTYRYLIGVPNSNFDNSSTKRISPDLDIGAKYGVVDVKMSGGTSSTVKRILFDHQGRPYRGTGSSTAAHPLNSPVDFLSTSTILIKLCVEACVGNNRTVNAPTEIMIAVEPETGYAHIL